MSSPTTSPNDNNSENKKINTAVDIKVAHDPGDLEQDVAVGTQTPITTIDLAYLRSTKMSTFYRSVLFQMILFGALSFVGPVSKYHIPENSRKITREFSNYRPYYFLHFLFTSPLSR